MYVQMLRGVYCIGERGREARHAAGFAKVVSFAGTCIIRLGGDDVRSSSPLQNHHFVLLIGILCWHPLVHCTDLRRGGWLATIKDGMHLHCC